MPPASAGEDPAPRLPVPEDPLGQPTEAYGAPRIHAELRAQGIRCGRKRVARLMRQAGLAGVRRPRSRGTTRQHPEAVAAPDLVQRDFTASAPDQLWVADLTYVTTGEGWR